MSSNSKRLIEDYLPIEDISAEASREKSVRKGHISTLHLWWARRPLVACRAAIYGALVPASRFAPTNGPEEKRASLGRANAAKFVRVLCTYHGSQLAISAAKKDILEAHAERLSLETGKNVTVEDISAGREPRPKVLDMFAGGGAMPLEALRLGCESYALDLNPVAHVIELCTLVYPQKYGKSNATVRGMTGPKDKDGNTTWGGLANEIRYWGGWLRQKVKAEIGDLYPLIPDPEFKRKKPQIQTILWKSANNEDVPAGYLVPAAFLWTRIVRCKNPACGAAVPLAKQTWLCKRKGRYVALKVVAPKGEKRVRAHVVEATTAAGLGFDPSVGSESGNAACPFCGTVADSQYVQHEGTAGRVGFQHLAVVCRKSRSSGTTFLPSHPVLDRILPSEQEIQARTKSLTAHSDLSIPQESINSARPSPNARGLSAPTRHGLNTFSALFHPRQLLSLLTQCEAVRNAFTTVRAQGVPDEQAKAIVTYLGILIDRMVDRGSSMCRWDPSRLLTQSTFGRPALAFVWDFSEANPFGDASGDMTKAIGWIVRVVEELAGTSEPASVGRGSALCLPYPDESIDVVVTDPPYYDNVPYGDLSDFFYVWLKRAIGSLYPEHFSSEVAPKKSEATALSSRFNGDMKKASTAYEEIMLAAFKEARRVLKPNGPFVVVYAHKTTLGWSTLVDALRQAGFTVTEAWPLDTEFAGRLVSQEAAALASSIFLAARKREGTSTGSYEEHVRPELEEIVRERVDSLWKMGITGADLVISCVGAGLRAFTRYARVEYANGEEVPAARFLAEVESAVLDAILARLSNAVGANGGRYTLERVDSRTRFYILWRYTYSSAELDAGEAITFANGTHVELDGPTGLSVGPHALVQKKKGKFRLLDYSERGGDPDLGLLSGDGQVAPIIDTLHRALWFTEHRPAELAGFLQEAKPDLEQMRLVAQALLGPALKGGELFPLASGKEPGALSKLTANWRPLIEEATLTASSVKRGPNRVGTGRMPVRAGKRTA